MNCNDCGCKLDHGICPNCFEELYINDYQMPEDPIPVSDEWREEVRRQRQKQEDIINGGEY